MAEDTVEQAGIEATLPKGFEGTLNGLEVVFKDKFSFVITNARSNDQAAELVHIHRLPVDFAHFDDEKGVHVTYQSVDAARVEQTPEQKAAAEAAIEASRAEATAGEEPATGKKK